MAIKSKEVPGLSIAFCDMCFEVVEVLRFPPQRTLEEAAQLGEIKIVSTSAEHKCDAIKPDRRHEWGRRAAVEEQRQEPGRLDHEELED